jgi:CotS family spore coat protein
MNNDHSALDNEILNVIDQYWGLRVTASRQHRKVWRLETAAGPFYLKKTKLTSAELNWINAVLIHLHRQGFDQTPLLMKTPNGDPFLQTAAGRYVLTPWLNGKELDFRTFMDLKQASVFLARFHLQSWGFVNPPNAVRSGWPDWPGQLAQRINQLTEFCRLARSEKETAPFSRLYLRYFEPFYRQAILSCERLSTVPYPAIAATARQQSGLCHHDFSGRNILWTYDNRLALVDFDYCLQDIRIHDLINLLVRNLKHNNWRSDLARLILTTYHQTAPLAREELEVMQVLLAWPQDFWQIGLQYYIEKLPWPPERFLKKLQHRTQQRFERERFLKEFPEQNGIYQWQAPVPLSRL